MLVIIFVVTPLIYSYINYEALLSNLSLQQQYLSSSQYAKVLLYNKKAQSNISALKTYEGLYGPILSIFGSYNPTREITLSAFNLNNAIYYLINDTKSINSVEALNLSNTNPAFISKMQALSSPSYGSMQAKTALSELNSKSLMPALYNKLSFEISIVDNSFTNIQNKAEIYYTLLSGNKSYTIIYLNNNSLSSIQGNIAKYVYITISNGKVINVVNPNNAGDLNTIPKSTSVVASSESISTLVNTAFKVNSTGVLYITKSAQDSFNTALPVQNLVSVYTGPNNNTRILAINLIKKALGSHSIDLYITNPQYQYINLLLK